MKPKQCNTVNILFWWLREEREEEALGLMLMLRGKTITVFQEPVCFDELRKRVYNSRVPVNNDMRGSPRCAVIPSSSIFLPHRQRNQLDARAPKHRAAMCLEVKKRRLSWVNVHPGFVEHD